MWLNKLSIEVVWLSQNIGCVLQIILYSTLIWLNQIPCHTLSIATVRRQWNDNRDYTVICIATLSTCNTFWEICDNSSRKMSVVAVKFKNNCIAHIAVRFVDKYNLQNGLLGQLIIVIKLHKSLYSWQLGNVRKGYG
jgi:hypothetical protein